MTIQDIITRTRVLLSDQEDQEFTDEEIMLELNAALLELNTLSSFYVREESLPIRDGLVTYELPHDTIELRRLRRDGADGPEIHRKAEGDLVQAGPVQAVLDQSANAVSLTQAITPENIDSLGAGANGAMAYPWWGR